MKTNDLKCFTDLVKKAKFRNPINILNWIKVKDGVISFNSLNMTIAQSIKDLEGVGEFYIPVQLFIDLVGIKNKDISFNVSVEDKTVIINGGADNYLVDFNECFDSDGTPCYLSTEERFEELKDIGMISSADIQKIKKVSLYCEKSSSLRPRLESVFLDKENIVATNANWLAYYESESRSVDFMIPSFIPKIIEGFTSLSVSQNDNYINLYDANFQITINFRKVEDTFPDYKAVIPKYFIATVIFDAKDFIEKYAVAKAIFGKFLTVNFRNNVLLKMEFTEERMVCEAKHEDKIFGFEIASAMNGEFSLPIGVNMEMLLQIIRNENLDAVEMQLVSSNKGIIINGKVLLMPMEII